jgi:hypothetical protein
MGLQGRLEIGGMSTTVTSAGCTSAVMNGAVSRVEVLPPAIGRLSAPKRTFMAPGVGARSRTRPFLSDANALLNIGRRSPRADIASAGWKCL